MGNAWKNGLGQHGKRCKENTVLVSHMFAFWIEPIDEWSWLVVGFKHPPAKWIQVGYILGMDDPWFPRKMTKNAGCSISMLVASWRICCCRPLYSSRFATRTVRTQGIGRRGKKRAYLAQPKADWGQARPSLALSWPTAAHLAQLGRNLRRARASWLQLGPNLGPTWAQLGLACATWSCVGHLAHQTTTPRHRRWGRIWMDGDA